MAEGTVVRIADNGQYGFIQQDDGGEDVYFRVKWVKSLPISGVPVGLRVEYEPMRTSRGLQTRWIKALSSDEGAWEGPRSYRFLNPYNFVRSPRPPQVLPDDTDTRLLSRCPPPPHDRWIGLNGTIMCELEAVSPLFISDPAVYYASEEDEKKGHKTFRFYQYDFGTGPEPALPASSLRGMVRHVFEAVTNSCYAHFDYDKRLSYHLPTAEALKLTPARVEKDEQGHWRLRLLPGTSQLVINDRPRDMLYAARVERYEALAPGRRRKRRGGPPPPFTPMSLDGLQHGDHCFALAEELSFPPVWNVVRLAHTREDLLPHQQRGQKILEGYLCINNQNIEAKRFERFFFHNGRHTTGPKYISLPDGVRREYAELIKDYQSRHEDSIKKWRRDGKDPSQPRIERDKKEAAFSRFVIGGPREVQEGDLVYAMLSGTAQAPTVKFIVPVAVPRVGYERKVAQLLADHLWKCEKYEHLCPACRTFGWVYGYGQEDQELTGDQVVAYAGRIRFEHGRLVRSQQVRVLPRTTLAILSSPKPTTSRFYLKPSNDRPRRGLSEFQAGYDNPDNVLRGRKTYRHQGHTGDAAYWGVQDRGYSAKEQSDQNRTIEGALMPGVKFEFTVQFENLATVELGSLLWSLQLEGEQYHRLGFAKPLGFGSVRVNVRQVSLIDPSERYSPGLPTGERSVTNSEKDALITQFKQAMRRAYQQSFDELPHVQDLLALLGDPDPDLPIHYPRPEAQPSPEGKNYEWFMGNNRNKDARYVLEMPGQEDGLPLIDKAGNVKL